MTDQQTSKRILASAYTDYKINLNLEHGNLKIKLIV